METEAVVQQDGEQPVMNEGGTKAESPPVAPPEDEVEKRKRRNREASKRWRKNKKSRDAKLPSGQLEEAKQKELKKRKEKEKAKQLSLSPEELEKQKQLERDRKRESRAKLSPEEKEKANQKKREHAKEKREAVKKEKEGDPKGFRGEDWLLTDDFVKKEKRTTVVSDAKERDDNGCHYLGKLNIPCGFCGGLGFQAEVQGTFLANPDDPGSERLVHFGSLCCCKGTVDGIDDYNLPPDLKWLYESDDPMAVSFREDARTFNNGMAMCSLTAQHGWRSRTPNKKQDSMLTAGGQLLRRVGSLLPADGERPKCVQTYFYGGKEATDWRMLNIRKKVSSREQNSYRRVFDKLHGILTEADNKYIKSFLGVKEYVETHLKDKVWDVKLSIHANESPNSLIHKGRLNAPTVNEIAILMPSNDVITKNHKR